MSEESFVTFLTHSLCNLDIIKKGCIYYVCMGTSTMCLLNQILQEHNFTFSDYIVWEKPNFTLMRNGYQRKYELLWYGWYDSPALHQIENRTQTNIWVIGIAQDFKDKNLGNKWMQGYEHPTQKPIALPAYAIENSTTKHSLILDLFLGSGTTLIACEQLERTCYGMEIEPRYIDIILDRWAKLTGEEPLREDGITWSELKTENGIQ